VATVDKRNASTVSATIFAMFSLIKNYAFLLPISVEKTFEAAETACSVHMSTAHGCGLPSEKTLKAGRHISVQAGNSREARETLILDAAVPFSFRYSPW